MSLGVVNFSGWTNGKLVPGAYVGGKAGDDYLDFDFLADPPSGFANWEISPVNASITLQGLPATIKAIRVHAATGVPVERKLDDPGTVALAEVNAGKVTPFGASIDPRGDVTLRNWRFENGELVVDAEITASIEVCYIIRCDKVLDIRRTETIRISMGQCMTVIDLGVLKLEACYKPPKDICVKLTADVRVWKGVLFERCITIPI